MWPQSPAVRVYSTQPHPLQTQRAFSKLTITLFLIMAAYTAIPFIDVPLMGLSLSAPIFYVVVLAVLLRPPEPWFHRYRGWIFLAFTIWAGIVISALGNGLISSGTNFDSGSLISLIRFAYWILVFVVTTYLVSRARLGAKVVNVLAAAAVMLALLRWSEAIFWGRIGPETARWMTQNSYGALFSSYAPFVLVPLATGRGWQKIGALMGVLLIWSAAAINGSRGSWLSITIGILLFTVLYVRINPRHIKSLIWVILLSGLLFGMLSLAPERITAAVDHRFATLQRLDEDKSYAIRQLMTQKGWRLFKESPLIGVGINRFRRSSVPLDIPPLLRYAPQSHFDAKTPHNSYVAFLAETGLAGTIPFGILLLILVIGGYRAVVRLGQRGKLWPLGIYTSFLAMSIHMWAISSLTGTGPWLIYGLAAATIVSARQDEAVLELSTGRRWP